ncbi:MAG: FtsX-like permease family protein, partial [Acidobacteriia bacterium]|nr:FtsX-like permease family protein [Terriglobia bacterium]
GDVRHDIWDRDPRAVLYIPFVQEPTDWMDLGVRAEGDPLRLASAVTAAIRPPDPEAPVSDVFTMSRLIRNDATAMIYVAVLMGVFGVLALVLSSIGVYGVMAYLVSEQTHEIGVRIALGASAGEILGTVFRRGMTTALAGLALGLGAAYGMARLLASLVFGVTATDPATFLAIPAALIASAALAIYVPARRAMKVDPIAALRYE